jgi:2-keto-4-pentenoate hydratase/2-oxohepta-3-ene-1,7-dioic acid hydratase in catechol pathway
LGDPPRPDGRTSHWLRRLRLRAPVPNPRKIFCLAGNYQEHIEEGGAKMAAQDRETPRVFMKPPSTTVTSPGDAILIPPVARSVDWEGELAVVMGRRAKGVKAADALRYVAGYTVMNDVSERRLLIKPRSETRPRDEWFDWLNGKWLDTFAPHGPWLVTSDEIPDPQVLEISTFVNGERKQHNNTGQMLYPVARIIEYISAIITLEPGDLISTGTIAGVGSTTGTFLQPGDRVEIEISGIGVLRNKVAASAR